MEISPYENDCEFTAYIIIAANLCDPDTGEPYPNDDPRSGCAYGINPLEEEPELHFALTCRGEDVLRFELYEPVTVTYDPESMEVLSIIQNGERIY